MPETTGDQIFPVLPLRDIVVFPHMIVPLFVGRDKSVLALEDVMNDDKQILLATQKNAAQDDPGADDIFRMGTIATVLQLLKLPDGTVKVLVEGNRRAKIKRFTDKEVFFEAEAGSILDTNSKPESITNTIPLTVKDDSATLVLITIFLVNGFSFS